MDDHVVYAHGHEIDADGVVAIEREGELLLGAHAVGRGHQNGVWIAEPGQAEQGPEAAHAAHDPGAHGTLRQGLDAFDQGVAALDVHTGIPIAVWRLTHAIMVTMPARFY